MASSFTPYSFVQCPCYDAATHSRTSSGRSSPQSQNTPDDDDYAFDPRAPRSNYSLYPIEHLLYCVDCNQIRCPRCVTEELVTIYCPSCLFEVGASSVKAEGNRCTRSCFQCPICIGPLGVQSLAPAPEPSHLTADNAGSAPPGPWVLCCSYCNWSSSEVGVQFDKPQGIYGQLAKMRHGNALGDIPNAPVDAVPTKRDAVAEPESAKSRFAAMKSFYQSQLASANPATTSLSGSFGDYGFGSPNALTRIMSLYSGSSGLTASKTKARPTIIREADSESEGLRFPDLDESDAISKLRQQGYDGTVTRPQAMAQVEEGARFADEMWPIPHLLRSKRAKRCPACRHILSKPEAKVNNTRFRIRLVAVNYLPEISSKPLIQPGLPLPPSDLLIPLKPTQYLLTFKNLMFEDIKVSLATPNTTPGRFASRVTVLCPQFTIEANSDDYDINEVLKDDRRRERADTLQQVEPGKVWERGRNWVSIVVEVIPSSLHIEPKPAILKKDGNGKEDLSPLKEDEDILEIPIFVRLEWESDPAGDQVTSASKEKDGKEKKELAYWTVLGIGRISQE
ncbi:hypothetical protein E8E14_001072 [Neopestalotiopsis sp. 37M]|nr:hypothetical protein E8E14_001072 [Neopestalotiopsis sp. 37M]